MTPRLELIRLALARHDDDDTAVALAERLIEVMERRQPAAVREPVPLPWPQPPIAPAPEPAPICKSGVDYAEPIPEASPDVEIRDMPEEPAPETMVPVPEPEPVITTPEPPETLAPEPIPAELVTTPSDPVPEINTTPDEADPAASVDVQAPNSDPVADRASTPDDEPASTDGERPHLSPGETIYWRAMAAAISATGRCPDHPALARTTGFTPASCRNFAVNLTAKGYIRRDGVMPLIWYHVVRWPEGIEPRATEGRADERRAAYVPPPDPPETPDDLSQSQARVWRTLAANSGYDRLDDIAAGAQVSIKSLPAILTALIDRGYVSKTGTGPRNTRYHVERWPHGVTPPAPEPAASPKAPILPARPEPSLAGIMRPRAHVGRPVPIPGDPAPGRRLPE